MRRGLIVLSSVGIAALLAYTVWFTTTGLTQLAPNAGDPSHPRSPDETSSIVGTALVLGAVLVAALLATRNRA